MDLSTEVDLQSFQVELNDLRARTLAKLGADDAAHIDGVRRLADVLEVVGRTLIHFSLEPVSFGVGVVALGTYKILENMEIGHNVMHGQYDFLEDPELNSATYEWDIVGTAKTWKHAHNVTHHVYTNVLGKDDDFGYTFFRLSSEVPWKARHLTQVFSSLFVALTFDHMVSYYHARPSEYLTAKRGTPERGKQRSDMAKDWRGLVTKTARHHIKELLFFPMLAGPLAPKVALGNVLAQAIRNIWSYAVIHCGHLPLETSVFTEEDFAAETRGGYYLRQMTGSANIEAGPILGVLTGHLSHQIEHHLFPDIPAWRYPAMAPEVKRIAERHGVPYHTGSLSKQYGSVVRALLRYAVPNAPKDTRRQALPRKRAPDESSLSFARA